jgi:hypothetical protein
LWQLSLLTPLTRWRELDQVVAELSKISFIEHASWTVRTPD